MIIINESFRKCVIIHLNILFRKYLDKIKDNYNFDNDVKIIEEQLFNASVDKIHYYKNYLSLLDDENFVELHINKVINVQKIFSLDKNIIIREKAKNDFKKLLLQHPYFKLHTLEAEYVASDIENSCYNNTIEKSKNSDEIICRRWDEPLFKNIYEMRCHIIKNLIDIYSLSNSTYTIDLIDRIINKNIDTKMIGMMSERELCNISFKDENAEIDIRSTQKINYKSSNLFPCPKCHQKNCIYNVQQISASDESPHFMCQCLNPNCGERFIRRG